MTNIGKRFDPRHKRAGGRRGAPAHPPPLRTRAPRAPRRPAPTAHRKAPYILVGCCEHSEQPSIPDAKAWQQRRPPPATLRSRARWLTPLGGVNSGEATGAPHAHATGPPPHTNTRPHANTAPSFRPVLPPPARADLRPPRDPTGGARGPLLEVHAVRCLPPLPGGYAVRCILPLPVTRRAERRRRAQVGSHTRTHARTHTCIWVRAK